VDVNILFRTDASIEIGTGHVMRCLSLAKALHEKGMNVSFFCREKSGDLCKYIEMSGFSVFRLKSDPHWITDALEVINIIKQIEKIDWLIVDQYVLDHRWEKKVKPYIKRIMVIDDLANRKHDCKLLLDQNLVESWKNRYDDLVPKDCIKLLGPEFALLRPEFKSERNQTKIRTGEVQRIFVFLGGSDPTNTTIKVLKAIYHLNRPEIKVDVIVGNSNPNKDDIKDYCAKHPNINYYLQTNQIASLMRIADLAIGAGGSTTWERCCLGLPSIVLAIADNQKLISQKMHDIGAVYYLGDHSEVAIMEISRVLDQLINKPEFLQTMSNIGFDLIDGDGITRVVNYLLNERSEV
jgi:UDP-2,4-diacetamido-2,4,6-trideoxy-beta-L-altropyranose hydrolase